jgi:hypothetical protein
LKSQFEEKSYEAAFNAELGQGPSGLTLFAPGQHLEAHLGFDVAWDLLPSDPFWRAIGLASGAGRLFPAPQGQVVPASTFNLFIQYKCSDWLHGRRSKHRAHFGGDYYRFTFDHPARQLDVLQALEANSVGAARVVYAAPHFHTVHHLMVALGAGTVIADSVVVEAQLLGRGHKAYNFSSGRPPLLNPEPERAEGVSGDVYFSELASSTSGRTSWTESLSVLHSAVTETPGWSRLSELAGDAELRGEGSYDDRAAMRQYLDIQLFAWMNNLRWVTLG